jgi:hypothetical protein
MRIPQKTKRGHSLESTLMAWDMFLSDSHVEGRWHQLVGMSGLGTSLIVVLHIPGCTLRRVFRVCGNFCSWRSSRTVR